MTITDPATGMPLSPGSERIVVSSSEAEVERVHLQTSAGVLSALFVAPTGPPRATIVALHGAGMTARYFHGRLLPGQSLMALAAQLGYNVLCVDRPGYGASAIQFSDGLLIDEQADVISDGVQHFLSSRSKGRGIVLVAHSFGGKIAMVMGARQLVPNLLGIEISGCGYRFADSGYSAISPQRNWGPLRLYPPRTFTTSKEIVTLAPARELNETASWAMRLPDVAARLSVPVRMTFAEHEGWWQHDERAIGEIRELLVASPRVEIEHHRHAGHNISLGWSARAYHLKALAFADECAAA